MEPIILRLSFFLSILYTIISYFRGMYYQDYLKKSILIFGITALSLMFLQYLLLKLVSKAKISVIEEDLLKEYEQIRKRREERKKAEEEDAKKKRERQEQEEKLKLERQDLKQKERGEARKRVKEREKSRKLSGRKDY